jgi:hypothetical protein
VRESNSGGTAVAMPLSRASCAGLNLSWSSHTPPCEDAFRSDPSRARRWQPSGRRSPSGRCRPHLILSRPSTSLVPRIGRQLKGPIDLLAPFTLAWAEAQEARCHGVKYERRCGPAPSWSPTFLDERAQPGASSSSWPDSYPVSAGDRSSSRRRQSSAGTARLSASAGPTHTADQVVRPSPKRRRS